MSIIMKGSEVAVAVTKEVTREAGQLKAAGIDPCLAIVRVGARPDDLAYERGAKKRMEMTGISCRVEELPEDITQEAFEEIFEKINADADVHGILLFRPLPEHLDEERVKRLIDPKKDVDCMSPINMAKIFSGDATGFAPCTPEAVMRMLSYYNVPLAGKRTVVIGRSMVVGKPLAMMLLKENATVTLCHTKTKELAKTCRDAELLIAAAGRPRMVTPEMAKEGAVVVDVGINVDEKGKLCGDVDYDPVRKKAGVISPVPGGVGSVTSSVLAAHVIRAAKMAGTKS